MTWLSDRIPSPHAREALTLVSFFRDIVAPFLCYYATAVLVLLPNTLAIRLAVLPLTLWTFFNGATRLDLVKAYNDERLAYLNQGLVIIFTALSLRLIVWSIQTKPFWRVKTLEKTTPEFYTSSPPPLRPKQIFVDAFELSCNLRGCGWNWSPYLQIPQETRPTSSFAAATWTSLLLHIVMFDVFQYSIQWFSPTTIGSARGGSIFDPTLPPILNYSRSTLITFLSGMAVYFPIQAGYHITTLFGVLVFGQDTSLWPPAFMAPWLSTSLTEFWAKRWHQLFRDIFISLGGQPMSILFGRAGGVLGAFLISGILHNFGLWGMGRGTDFMRVGGFFIMNGVGIILEHTWRKLSGHRVAGWYGRVWTLAWLIGWGHILVEAWATRGLIGSTFLPQYLRLTTYIFGPLQ
ncbi:membrane bound O-acyl transferase family-domain-containing protein [Lyophyllum atratum]|nr:membrane bound O-acyl transferase family-domain-containing protein [Lyophyllum atratum]